MASGNADGTGWNVPANENDESGSSSQPDGEHEENIALRLSMDSGTSSAELSQMQSDNENVKTCDRDLCKHLDTSGFSEEELLNVTFEACDAAGRGEVLASTVVQFLQAMTGHSGGQDKLIVLKQMLDPEGRDPAVGRDAFHSTMKKWIAQCSQDGLFDDGYPAPGPETCKATANGAEFFPSLTETTFTDQSQYHCDSADLLVLVAELKHAQRRLRGQNSSLLRSVSQCEEINLQLMMDVSELRSKLASAQLCAGRAQSLAEELDEARRALRESQERTGLAQANSRSLIKEIEHLKAHIKVMEEMNGKLLLERNSAEDRLNKLRRANTDMREEMEEVRLLLAMKERENTKKNVTLQKLKDTFLDYHRIIDGLQCDLVRLQEHSQRALLSSFDKCSSNLRSSGVPNHYSLHHEIQEAEPRTRVEENGGLVSELQPPSSPKKELYDFIQKVKTAELRDVYSADSLQKAFLQEQQEQASTKHQLLTILRELERPRPPWLQQPERRQTQEVRSKAPPITWWKALRVENERHTWNTRDIQDTTREMQERITALEVQLKDAQMEVRKSRTELGEVRVLTERAAAAVQTEQVEDEWKRLAAEKVLESLRKVEAVVTKALRAAEVLTESQRRMRERMEAIGHKVEEALSRTTDVEMQLSGPEERPSSLTQSPDVSGWPDPTSSDTECRHRPEISSNLNMTNGGCFRHAGAEDPSPQREEAEDTTGPLSGSSERPVKCESVVLSVSFSDHLPVGPPNTHPPPAQDCSVGRSAPAPDPDPNPDPVSETSCEERKHHDTRQKGARIDSRSEEPDSATDSPIKPEEKSNRRVSAEDDDDDDETLDLKKTEDPDPKQDAEGTSQEAEDPGSPESEFRKRFETSEKSGSEEPAQNFLKEGEAKSRRRSEEGLETSAEETNGNVKGSVPEWTRCTPGSEDARRSDACEGGSFNVCPVRTPEPAGTLKEELSVGCGAAGAPAEPASPLSFRLTPPESNTPFFFPHTRSRPSTAPAMPTLPEEEEDSPEEVDSASSSPSSSVLPLESKLVNVTLSPPAIVLPRQVTKQEPGPLEKVRPHSPRPRLSRSPTSSGPITTVDNDGHMIDLVKDELPEMQLSDKDRQKNLELLEEAKKVSERFLTRRGRRSRCSPAESPTALSPNPTPCSSPVPSRSSSVSAPPQTDVLVNLSSSPSTCQRLEVPAAREHGEAAKAEQETLKKLVELKPPEKRKVSSGTLNPRHTPPELAKKLTPSPKDSAEPGRSTDKGKKPTSGPAAQKADGQSPATGVAKPVPRPAMQQAPCTAEIKTIGAFPPLMRAVSWDTVGSLNMRNGGSKGEDGDPDTKSPATAQKLSKLREEHKLLRNQSISGSKLPDLNESVEQDQDPSSSSSMASAADEESKEKADSMPNISDLMLRKLKLHRGLTGCAPPLTEKEVENAFVQLSLAFRNDNYTLESRLKQAERERNLTEENTEKELEEFKTTLKSTVSLWQNVEQRDFYQRLMETVAVLHRLANRLSSRAEMVGAVRQEKRMNKATEVMLQYVENLKRTYEKDHAELMEFKKLANLNSNRCYGGSMETGDDGVPRTARSMSLTMGKALPRRRVSVAVVPKFNLLNIPGVTPSTGGPTPGPGASLGPAAVPNPSSGPGALPVLCEANSTKSDSGSDPTQQAGGENGKVLLEQEGEAATPAKSSCSAEEIRAEIKAQIEEEAYNKGYQEGLKRLKELQEVKEEKEKAEEKEKELEELTKEELEEGKQPNRLERVLDVLDRIRPKIFRRNRTLWIVLTIFLVVLLLVNIMNFFAGLYADRADAAPEKPNVPGKKFLGVRVGTKSSSPE